MTQGRDFKRLVRVRMRETGEPYMVARAHLLSHPPPRSPGTAGRLLAGLSERARRMYVSVHGGQHGQRGGSGVYPFERFTERAKHVLTYAQEEASRSRRSYIGTEHLLVGLLREQDGLAAKVLADLGVEIERARRRIEQVLGREKQIIIQQTIPTSRVKKVIEISFQEARRMDLNYVATEHLLLALLIDGKGIGAKVLTELGVTLDRVRGRITELGPGDGQELKPPLSADISQLLDAATALAAQEHAAAVTLDHLRQALADASGS